MFNSAEHWSVGNGASSVAPGHRPGAAGSCRSGFCRGHGEAYNRWAVGSSADHSIMKCRCPVRGSLYEPSGGVRWSGNRGSGDSAETDACASPSLEALAWCLSGASPGGLWSNGDSRRCSIACNRYLTALQKRSASLRSTQRPSPVPSRLIGDVVLARLDDPRSGS